MVIRVVAFVLLLTIGRYGFAQVALPALGSQTLKSSDPTGSSLDSAWIDLRQSGSAQSKPQVAPAWVESVTFTPAPKDSEAAKKSVFRIRLAKPNEDCQILLFRLYFDDLAEAQPELVAWDESGTQVIRSGALGQKTGLATSSSTTVPMIGVSAIDIEVPGDGRSIRGAYLDWMKSSQVMRPVHAPQQKLMADPFDSPGALKAGKEDSEALGTVKAPLTTEIIPIGPSMQTGGAFQFGLEAQPLIALITFEVASPQIESPPEIYVNGQDVGPVTLILPDLADPAYRGLSVALLDNMQFQYTGWVRAQKIVPASVLKAGTNDVMILAGAGTSASAVRETQMQLKYLWDKSDYLLEPLK
jgi:hypothetical protein